jgi:hypothetical protein
VGNEGFGDADRLCARAVVQFKIPGKSTLSAEIPDPGGVAERPMAPVLKTGKGNSFEGSNPSPSVFKARSVLF